MRHRPELLLLALFGLLTACSRRERAGQSTASSLTSTQVAVSSSDARPRDHATRPSAGCRRPRARTGDFHLQTTDGNGTPRDYRVLVPATHEAGKPLALTFVYHGSNANEDDAKAFGLSEAQGARNASIFVFPRGIPYQSFGVGWDDHCGGYDMIFFDHMLAALEQDYCVDESAVFAAGFSWGGDYVTGLACCRGPEVRAVAAAACTDEFADPRNYLTYDNVPCPSAATTAIRFTFDPRGDSALSAQQFTSTSALYRALNGCSSSSAPAGGGCVAHRDCAEPFLECPYPGLGHALPPGWADDTWRFFAQFMPTRAAPTP